MAWSSESERQRRFLGRGALTSLLLHSGFLFPLVTLAFILGAREEAEREEQVEMTFDEVDPSTLPLDLPPIDDTPPKKRPRPEVAVKDDPVKPEPKPKEEPPPPEEQPPPPPQPKPEEIRNKKSVAVEVEKETEPDPNAQFLAEKSNKVDVQTRADRTNLEKQSKQKSDSSSPSDRKEETPGDAEDKIAQTEEVASKQGRSAPDVTPRLNPSLSGPPEKKSSLLSMRNNEKRKHEISPETSFPELPRDPNGDMPLPPEHLESMKDLAGRGGPGSRINLRLTAKQYEYLFGDDREAAAALAKKQASKKIGRFTEKLNRIQSALENFIPEVQPGNQTALNTRAAPFAEFIARMHREIHQLWAFGFLDDLTSKPYSDPLNNRNLISVLEIVLAGDGQVDKVAVIRPSGLTTYDAAAIDVVYSAGPYAEPPPAIRSKNGKIYIHWTFHRDERACATFGVDYFILDNGPPPGGDTVAASAGTAGGNTSAPQPYRGRMSAPPHEHAEGERGHLPEPDREASRRASARLPQKDDPAARRVAEGWFAALVGGDVAQLLRDATFPFKTAGGESADSGPELARMLRDLVAEEPLLRPAARVELLTAAGLRAAAGSIPGAFGDGTGMLFATARVGRDMFVLALNQEGGRWKACGLVRL